MTAWTFKLKWDNNEQLKHKVADDVWEDGTCNLCPLWNQRMWQREQHTVSGRNRPSFMSDQQSFWQSFLTWFLLPLLAFFSNQILNNFHKGSSERFVSTNGRREWLAEVWIVWFICPIIVWTGKCCSRKLCCTVTMSLLFEPEVGRRTLLKNCLMSTTLHFVSRTTSIRGEDCAILLYSSITA